MKKQSIILAIFLALFMIAFLATNQVSAQVSIAKRPSPPPPDPVMDKLNLILEKLEQIPPTWSQKLSATERFEVVLNSQGVLDHETGLVWEKSPSTINTVWFGAQNTCNNLAVGNRKGWRAPTIQELASLVDPSVQWPGPTLPSGHPFSNVQSSVYWSASTSANDTNDAWGVDFSTGDVVFVFKPSRDFVWCVRGGQGVDLQ